MQKINFDDNSTRLKEVIRRTKIKDLMTADLQYCTVLDNGYEAA
ncbi:CBS domain-containing protein, partial [Bacillus vallismortis]|nr:CBS domain-containing protein [Bacillus vallismortis]